jgi:hypothetical protein
MARQSHGPGATPGGYSGRQSAGQHNRMILTSIASRDAFRAPVVEFSL